MIAACQGAGVSASAFDAWITSGELEPQAAEHAQAELVAKMRTVDAESAGT